LSFRIPRAIQVDAILGQVGKRPGDDEKEGEDAVCVLPLLRRFEATAIRGIARKCYSI